MMQQKGLYLLAILAVTLMPAASGAQSAGPGPKENVEVIDGGIFEDDEDQETTTMAKPAHNEESHESATHWSYSKQSEWPTLFPKCKSMSGQSPINIMTDQVHIRPEYELDFIDYDQEVEFQLKNTHHTIAAEPIADVIPSLRLNWLADDCEFELKETHFHWGDGVNKGSEHEINGQRAAAEMHLVHYRKGLTKDDIGFVENSVAVIGVFIESDSIEHSKLESLIEDAQHINGTSTEFTTMNSKHLINLLPSQHTFYTYNGSLTTPPCFEVVTWLVMSQPVYMSNERLIELSNIETFTPNIGRTKINANFREVQPLMDRQVYASFHTEELVSPEYIDRELSRKLDSSRGRFSTAFEGFWKRIEGLRKFYMGSRSAAGKR